MTTTTTKASSSKVVSSSSLSSSSSSSPNADIIANDSYVKETVRLVKEFYTIQHPEIPESHGLSHVMAVYNHAVQAVQCIPTTTTTTTTTPTATATAKDVREILIASLLHDVDDEKYFPTHYTTTTTTTNNNNNQSTNSEITATNEATTTTTTTSFNEKKCLHLNATKILSHVGVTYQSAERILTMIDWVSCSKNGNIIPTFVHETGKYYMLIPRWCDRLEAVGNAGVVRCYLYTKESGNLLSSEESPRPQTREELWALVQNNTQRFQTYITSQGTSTSADMISHYYDKLFHIAKPPIDIVQNEYLEQQAETGVEPLVEVCLRFGQTGIVDEDYLKHLVAEYNNNNNNNEIENDVEPATA